MYLCRLNDLFVIKIMKKYIKIYTIYLLSCLLCGCHVFEEKRMVGTVAEYNGKTITVEDIQLLTLGLSSEDSVRVVDQYIRQWATGLIEYDVAKDKTNKDIERLVEDYRRSLYLHEYEQRLIAQRMPQMIEDTLKRIQDRPPLFSVQTAVDRKMINNARNWETIFLHNENFYFDQKREKEKEKML